MSFRRLVRNLRKMEEVNNISECPKCGGKLRETYSSEIGFCPKCMQQFKLKPEVT